MEHAYLQTKHLTVGYHGRPLIEEIEISLAKGEIITLIGPNGAGKSTILKSIAKQLKLVAGQVLLENVSTEEMTEREIAKKTAIIFTERVSPELMTVWEVVALGRYPYTNGMGVLQERDRDKIAEVMELTGITDMWNLEFSKLSDGQKQRVLLAKALCQDPELLILDEPTSYLDIKYELEFFSIVQKLVREKKIGVLMSLHELALAERISDKLICIQDNHIERYGTPREIFKNEFIQKLYGIRTGSFDEKTGCIELERITGQSEVFVIAGNHTGSFLYRELQRKGICFSTGILSQNDLDYPIARALANRVIAAEAFTDFTELDYDRAKQEMMSCKRLICCIREFGQQNYMNGRLLKFAQETGLSIDYDDR